MECPEGCPDFSPAGAMLRDVRQAHEAVTVLLEARFRERLQIGASDVELLFTLAAANGRMRMADIADANGISRSGVTQTVDRLEKLGLVTRVAAPDDRRSTLATITEQGRTVFPVAHEILESIAADVSDALAGREIAALRQGLTTLIGAAREVRAGRAPAMVPSA